ncbi:MAG: BspA family leucine-rich repeat surface protein [Lachnospiraceae bacterium]|nr:BspA family leucine-rich repeat surface protein [Lachnospiraceae bacterium]
MKKTGMVRKAIALFCALNMLGGSLFQDGGWKLLANRVYAAGEEEEPAVEEVSEDDVLAVDEAASVEAELTGDEDAPVADETGLPEEEEAPETGDDTAEETEEPESLPDEELIEADPEETEEPAAAAPVLSKAQLEVFYNYSEDAEDPDGVKLSLTDAFRTALNTSGGSLTAGDYTWSENDPIPDPGIEYVTSDKTYKITDLSGLFQDLDKVKVLDMSGWDHELKRPYRDMSRMFQGCSSLTKLEYFSLITPECKTLACMFYDCTSLKECSPSLTTESVTSMACMFRYCSKLEKLYSVNYYDTSSLENMNFMFSNCRSLKWLNLENFGIGKVREMYGAFYLCTSLEKLNLSSFDFSYIYPATGHSLIGTDDLFLQAGNGSLQIYVRDEEAATVITGGDYNTAYSADSMEVIVFDLNALDDDFLEIAYEYIDLGDGTYRLELSDSLRNILDWNTSVSTQLYSIKAGDPLPNPDSVNSSYHGKISSYAGLFKGLRGAKVIDISLFDGKTIKDMSEMFFRCEKLQTLKMRSFQPRSDAKMDNMFWMAGCKSYVVGRGRHQQTVDAEAWVHDTDVVGLFGDPEKNTRWEEERLKLKVKWTVILDFCGKCEDPDDMIVELHKEDGSVVGLWTNVYSGFKMVGWYRDREYTQPFDTETTPIHSDITLYAKWEYVLSLTEGELEAFYDYRPYGDGLKLALNNEFKAALNKEEGTYYVRREDGSGYYVWHVGDPLPNPGLTHTVGGKTLPVNSYNALFMYSDARVLDLSKWETGNVTDMSKMFERCFYVKKLDVSSFDTSKVTTMEDMFVYFSDEYGYDTLDLKNFDVSHVTNMEDLFEFADIRSLDIDSWKTPLVTDMKGMFWCFHSDEIYMRKLDIRDDCNYEKFFHNNVSKAGMEVFVYLKNARMRNLFVNRSDEYGTALLHFVVAEDPEAFSDSFLEKFYVYDSYEVKYYKVSLTDEFKAQLNKTDGKMVMPGDTYTWHAGDPLPNPVPESSIKYRDKVRSYAGMFEGSTVRDLDLSLFNTKDITNYREMFKNCRNIKKLVLGDFRIDAGDDTTDMLLGTCASNTGTPVMGSVDDVAVSAILNDKDKTGIDTSKLTFKNLYVIRFAAGGGSGEMADISVEAGSSITLPECEFTPPEAATFDKWDKGKPGDKFTPDSSCTVKALWICSHVAVHTDAKASDCTTKGNIEYWTCERCGLIFADAACTHEIEKEDTELPALGHDWGNWKTLTEADSDHDGLEERVCRRDESHKEQRVVMAHVSYPEWEIVFDDECIRETTEGKYEATYTGSRIQPYVKVVHSGRVCALGVDYTLKYGKNKAAGEDAGTVVVKGKGSLTGSKTLRFTITKKSLADADVIAGSAVYEDKKSPEPVVAYHGTILKKGRDYQTESVIPGAILIKALETSNFSGDKTIYVTPVDKDTLKSHKIKAVLKAKDLFFDYDPKLPGEELTVTDAAGNVLTRGIDYRVSCSDNVRAGKVSMVIVGMGAYAGSVKKSYRIKAAAGAFISVSLDKDVYTYSKAGVRPKITVSATIGGLTKQLKEGRDFSCKFKNCKKPGTGSFTLTMKGDYKGAKYTGDTKFAIKAAEVTASNTVICASDMVFTKAGVYKPKVSVIVNGEVLKKSDFEVVYPDGGKMAEAGIMNIAVKLKGKNYTTTLSDISVSARIVKDKTDLKKAKFVLTQNGKSIKKISLKGDGIFFDFSDPSGVQPGIKLKDKTISGTELKTNFELIYADNTAAGKATLILKAESGSEYAGMCVGTFKIGKTVIGGE